MNVLLIGSGGREHALAWDISASPLLSKFYCAPGNAGIAEVAECIALDIADHAAVIAFLKSNPEAVLAEPCLYGRQKTQQKVGGVLFHLIEHEIHHRGFLAHKLTRLEKPT